MILFLLSLADGITHLDRLVESFESLPDFFCPRERLARVGMGADEASEIDHHRANVAPVPGGSPDDVPVALGFQHCMQQVDVLLREDLGRRGFGAGAGGVQPAVLDPGSDLQGAEPGFDGPAFAEPVEDGRGVHSVDLPRRRPCGS